MTMPGFYEWAGPFDFTTTTSYSDLNEVSGLYCIMLSDQTGEEELKKIVEYSNRIIYIGSGYIGQRLTQHSNLTSKSGNPEVQELLSKGIPLQFHMLAINDVTDEQLKSCEGDLIDVFEENYGARPHGNNVTPEDYNYRLPNEHFEIIDDGHCGR